MFDAVRDKSKCNFVKIETGTVLILYRPVISCVVSSSRRERDAFCHDLVPLVLSQPCFCPVLDKKYVALSGITFIYRVVQK